MRRICMIAALLVLILACVLVMPTQVQAADEEPEIIDSGVCGDNLTWTLDDEGTLTISGVGSMMNYPDSSRRPWNSVVSSVKKVIIADGVTSIGHSAFAYCENLLEVTIPVGITSIGRRAFQGCESLASVTLPNGLTTIGEHAFALCKGLVNVSIPNSVTSIGTYSFVYCSLDYNIYGNAKYLGNAKNPYLVLMGPIDKTITQLQIHPDTKLVYDYSFLSCSELTYSIYDNAKYFGTLDNPYFALLGATSQTITECNIHPDTKVICYGAFISCSSLTDITIPNGVISIGESAFQDCSTLTSVTIPNSVKRIAYDAFRRCSSLSNITIPDGVTSIGDYAFCYCGLVSVMIPNSVTEIGADVFSSCESLNTATVGNGLTYIGNYIFSGCDNLTSITLPNDCKIIPSDAFENCYNIETVYYKGTQEEWEEVNYNYHLSSAAIVCLACDEHNYTGKTIKKTSITTTGIKTYSCSECGDSYTEILPAKFYGTSINLGNTLDMYFGFYTGLVDAKGKVKFVREFADGTTETTEKPITAFNKNNSVYDITYTGLAAKEMCDTIHIYVYNGEGELVGEHSDSIRSYILRQLRDKNYGQEFRTLCVDLLNYGAEAQTTFGYNTGDLANKDLTAEELAEGTQTVTSYANKQSVTGTAAAYYGTAYILETKISMSMAVRASYFGDGCYALVSYTDHTGTAKDIRLDGKKNNSVYEFVLNEIVVADGRCLLTIEFYKADGTLVVTVQDSMESYTARNAAVYPLAEKMLAFSDSAYNYLH